MDLKNKTKDEIIAMYKGAMSEIEDLNKIIKKNKIDSDELLKSEQKFINLLKVIPDTIYKIDPAGYFTFVSESINFLGYKSSDLIGKHFSEIIHPDDLPFVSRTLVLPKFKGKETGDENSPKLFDERRSGKRITRCLDARIIKKGAKPDEDEPFMFSSIYSCGEIDSTGHYDNENGESRFLGTVGVIRDISDKKKVEEHLLKVEKLESIGVLAGGIAHDFNNILTAIIGNIALAKLEIDPHSSTFHSLTDAENATIRAKDLTKQLLTFSRGGSPVKNAASINELLKSITEFTLRGTNTKYRFNFSDNLYNVNIDEGQISQLINNLLINSSQVMPHGGYIDISAENVDFGNKKASIKDGKYLKISIKDYGTGIHDRDINKIFDPYFSTKENGTGLGLTTSYSIIKAHDGHISVESEYGKGTIFYIYIPATTKKIVKKEIMNLNAFSGKGRILLMDDDEEILRATGNLLKNFGYDVDTAKDGNEAILIYQDNIESNKRFDIIIIDLTIKGGLGGKETIKKLKEIDPFVKAIVSSGYSNDPVMSGYKNFGFDGAAEKPYRLESLIEVINKIMQKNN